MKRPLLKLTFVILCIWGVSRFCHHQTDGFALSHIHSNLSDDPRWEVAPLAATENQLLGHLLNKRFRYLTKGAQCYVFVSEDGSSVLKFFKHQHLRLPFLLDSLPLPGFLETWRAEKKEKKQQLLTSDFTSYKIAYEELKEETGLIYLHLNKTDHLKQCITLIDKLNIEHTVNLDDVRFILQKKAELVYPTLDKLMQKGQIQDAKNALTHLFHLMELKRLKGIEDKDPNVSKNFGFVEGKAIQIDIGRFSKGHTVEPSPKLEDFKHWLNSHYPELVQ